MTKLNVTAGIIISLVVVLGIGFMLYPNTLLRTVGVSPPVPVFTFDQSKASGWWAAGNYNGQEGAPKDYKGDEPIDKLPVAGMNVFQGKQGEHATACFVMVSYYDYHADIATLKAEKDTGMSKGDMQFRNVGDEHSSITTFEGVKQYTLTKYDLSGPGTENSMKGMSYGWVELDRGYIQVSGVCPTAAELDGTDLVSEALSLVRP